MSEGAARQALEAFPQPAAGSFRTITLSPKPGWRVTLAGLDFVTVFLAAGLSYAAYLASGLGRQHYEPGLYANLNLAFAAITVLSLHGSGIYRQQVGLLRIETVRRILYAVGTGVLLLLAVSFLVKFAAGFSRIHVLMLGPVVVVALVAQRFLVWAIADRLHTGRSTPVVVWGAGTTGRLLAQHLLVDHALGLQPVGFLDDDLERSGRDVRVGAGVEGRRLPVFGTGDALRAALRRTGATAVFLAMPSASPRRIAAVVEQLASCGVSYYVVPTAGDLVFSGMQFGHVGGMPVFTPRKPARSPMYEAAKRLLDVALASIVLVVTAPLLALSAMLVKRTSPGPAFFGQTRVGQDGEPFTIFKLRTMYRDTPSYAHHPRDAGDERITPVGRWLRRTSVDELPQLWNVIRGEMSLVGPRPEMPFVVAEYNDLQRQRLSVKPGVTGLWQISADRAFRIHDNLHYDLYYVENRSLAIDLSILLLTPPVLLGRNRAK